MLNGSGSALAPAAAESILVQQQRLSIAEPTYLVAVVERLPVRISTMVGGIVSMALQHAGFVDLAPVTALSSLHFFAGICTGVGYAALFGLIAHRLAGRSAQSLAWGPCWRPAGAALGGVMS